jgi:hypothetical protein
LTEGQSTLTAPQRILLDAGLAQMTQSVYTAAENILLKIAASVDGGAPAKVDNWHATLLARMSRAFPERRPAVLSANSLDALNKLRAFRHVVRNNYAHELDHERLVDNVKVAIALLPMLAADINELERYMSSEDQAVKPPTPQ